MSKLLSEDGLATLAAGIDRLIGTIAPRKPEDPPVLFTCLVRIGDKLNFASSEADPATVMAIMRAMVRQWDASADEMPTKTIDVVTQ